LLVLPKWQGKQGSRKPASIRDASPPRCSWFARTSCGRSSAARGARWSVQFFAAQRAFLEREQVFGRPRAAKTASAAEPVQPGA